MAEAARPTYIYVLLRICRIMNMSALVASELSSNANPKSELACAKGHRPDAGATSIRITLNKIPPVILTYRGC
jgi:hypothetical protein